MCEMRLLESFVEYVHSLFSLWTVAIVSKSCFTFHEHNLTINVSGFRSDSPVDVN
jgi:hypothetical protein